MSCEPAAVKVWLSVAEPFVTAIAPPMFVPPSLNCTVPPLPAGDTAALRSTAFPVFALGGTVTVVAESTAAVDTATVLGAEIEPPNSAPPEYTAEMLCAPLAVN